jgi:hypothetical protein
MSYKMTRQALGQLGGAWGWFSVWGNPGRSWQDTPRLLGWFYTDRETARFLVRRAHGTTPGHVPDVYNADWLHTVWIGGRSTFVPKWQEIYQQTPRAPGGGPCTDQSGCVYDRGAHVSWAYPSTQEAADAVREMANGDPQTKPGWKSSEDWVKYIIVGDQAGRRVY